MKHLSEDPITIGKSIISGAGRLAQRFGLGGAKATEKTAETAAEAGARLRSAEKAAIDAAGPAPKPRISIRAATDAPSSPAPTPKAAPKVEPPAPKVEPPAVPKEPNIFDKLGYGTRNTTVKPVSVGKAAGASLTAGGIAAAVTDSEEDKPATKAEPAKPAPSEKPETKKIPAEALNPNPMSSYSYNPPNSNSDTRKVPMDAFNPNRMYKEDVEVPTKKVKTVKIDPKTGKVITSDSTPDEPVTTSTPSTPSTPAAAAEPSSKGDRAYTAPKKKNDDEVQDAPVRRQAPEAAAPAPKPQAAAPKPQAPAPKADVQPEDKHAKSREMFQKATDTSNRGENDQSSYWAAEAQRQKELGQKAPNEFNLFGQGGIFGKKDKQVSESKLINAVVSLQGMNTTNIFEAAKKAKKDWDKDGKVESEKDEVWGSRFAAAKKAGKMDEEAEQINEKVKTTYENPLVTVHDKDGLHTHANLSTANKIFNTKVKHTDVHAGVVKTKDGHETKNNLTFAISKHHASAMKEEVIGEELKGNQDKIDANKNGKIDAQDFKLLRGKKKMDEAATSDPDFAVPKRPDATPSLGAEEPKFTPKPEDKKPEPAPLPPKRPPNLKEAYLNMLRGKK